MATELTYGQEIKQGLSDTFYNIGQGLRSFSIWFIVNLPILLIWAAIITVIVLIVRKILKIRAKKVARRQAAQSKSQGGIWAEAAARTEEKKASDESSEDE